MSTHLKYAPAERKATRVGGTHLHNIFYTEGHIFLSAKDRPYLSGLRDGGVEGAAELIDAIEKYGKIDLWVSE